MTPRTLELYLDRAFDHMLGVVDRLGDDRVNQRPLGPQTNAVAALVIHCCEVAEFWMGHVALGRPSRRDRAEEFSRTASVSELHELVGATRAQVVADLGRFEAGEGLDQGGRQFLPGGDTSDGSVVLHVIEELFQHLGHMEIAADALGVD